VTQRNGQRAGERGEGRHHDRPEAQQAGFVNGSLGILALGPLRLKREIDHHDRVLAVTSHLPHLIAYTIVGTVSDLEKELEGEVSDGNTSINTTEVARYSAGGFRDFTRIAASDPEMWRDVFLNNRDAILEMIGRFSEDLTALQRAIRWGEAETLESLFHRTREIRRGIIEMRQAGTFSATEPNEKE